MSFLWLFPDLYNSHGFSMVSPWGSLFPPGRFSPGERMHAPTENAKPGGLGAVDFWYIRCILGWCVGWEWQSTTITTGWWWDFNYCHKNGMNWIQSMETSLHVWTNMENDGNLIWLLVWNMNFIFHNLWDNPSHLTFLFFRGVETTVWNRNFMTFRILGMSSSHLTFIFFGGVGGLKPPTSNFSGDLDYKWLTINCMIINCTFNSYCGFQWLWSD